MTLLKHGHYNLVCQCHDQGFPLSLLTFSPETHYQFFSGPMGIFGSMYWNVFDRPCPSVYVLQDHKHFAQFDVSCLSLCVCKGLFTCWPDLPWLCVCLQVTSYLLDPSRLYDEEQTYKASLEIEPKLSRLSMVTNPSWEVLSQCCAALDNTRPGCRLCITPADLLLLPLSGPGSVTLLVCYCYPNTKSGSLTLLWCDCYPNTRPGSVTLLQCYCYPHTTQESVTLLQCYCQCYSNDEAGLDSVATGNL